MMNGKFASVVLCAFISCLACQSAQAGDIAANKADPSALPSPTEVRSLNVFPTNIALKGSDDARQVIVTAELGQGVVRDLTCTIQYEFENPALARITSSGRIIPLANGSTKLKVSYGAHKMQVSVSVAAVDQNLPLNFGNQVVPIFTKLGCNSGGCHGKASGQNGFKLSLLGFEPEVDYNALVYESRGRRVFPAAPEKSLLLQKATGQMAHGGGKRMETGSDEYKLVLRWIAAGMPVGQPSDPTVTKITVFPDHRILPRRGQQQFAVFAHYSDGSIDDITRRAQYESNDTEIATVSTSGLVETQSLSGEAAIMARYMGHVSTFRATVPLGLPVPSYEFPAKTIVDRFAHQKWQQLGLMPSEVCSDEQFIRRVTLDITGTLPLPDQIRKFVAEKDPEKRSKLVDALVETTEYSYLFANKWADILRVKRRGQIDRVHGTFAFHEWIRQAIVRDMPYDAFVREIMTATGDQYNSPATVWYKELQKPEQFVDDIAQVFLGLRMACAQCHHHPYEKWSQDDYWGLAAYFGRLGRKQNMLPGGIQNQQVQVLAIYNRGKGSVTNLRTGKAADFKPLDAKPQTIDSDDDPRQRLADWLTNSSNPFFARTVVNRYWAHFFGRGIVDPLDDMRVTNPPSNPELLDALAKDFVEHGYSLKHLVRTICKSRTYQLSAVPNQFNKHDKQAYARYYPRRLSAEVLYDAVCQVTNSPTTFGSLPQDEHGQRRAIMLPDESFSTYFLDVFGRPQRISACECERVGEANLAQSLHLLNSDEIQGKVARGGGRADMLAQDKRPDAEKIEEMFLWAFGRKPSAEDMHTALEHIKKSGQNKKAAYENILWALLNTKEFVFNK